MIAPTAIQEQTNARLPKGKTITDIFADFMRYLFDSTKTFFKVSEQDGEVKWDSASDNTELVLTHPNGWGGPQQTQLRTAAVQAGIVPDTPAGHSCIHFVTEGEASFNFCATHTQAGRNLKVRHAVPRPALVCRYARSAASKFWSSMRVLERSISVPTQFSTIGHSGLKSCMNQSVSRISYRCRFSIRSFLF